jgi:hypothetical protein
MRKYFKLIPYIAIIVLLYLYFSKPEIVKTITKTEVKYDTITKIIDNTKPQSIKKVYIRIKDTIKQYDTITKVVFKDKLVNKYTYVDTLQNGFLESTIFADMIYKRNIKLTTFNKSTTTETTNTIIKSNLFIGTDVNFSNYVHSLSVNAYYVHKDKWLAKLGIGSDGKPFYTIGVGFNF